MTTVAGAALSHSPPAGGAATCGCAPLNAGLGPDQMDRVVRIRTVVSTPNGNSATGDALVGARSADDRDLGRVRVRQERRQSNLAADEREHAAAYASRPLATPRHHAGCLQRPNVRARLGLQIGRYGELVAHQRRRVEALARRVVDEVEPDRLLHQMKGDTLLCCRRSRPGRRIRRPTRGQHADQNRHPDQQDGSKQAFHFDPPSLNWPAAQEP